MQLSWLVIRFLQEKQLQQTKTESIQPKLLKILNMNQF